MIPKRTAPTCEQREIFYWDSILGNCRPAEVKDKMGDYVEKSVRKNGWKARWNCPCTDSESQDCLKVLVEVTNCTLTPLLISRKTVCMFFHLYLLIVNWTGITSAVVGEIDWQCTRDIFEKFLETDKLSLHLYYLSPVALIKRMRILRTCLLDIGQNVV